MITNKPGAELAQTNLIYESTIYKGKSSSIYKCSQFSSPFLQSFLGTLKENSKMTVCVKSVSLFIWNKPSSNLAKEK